MPIDSVTESTFTPLLEQKVAKPGDFIRQVESTAFRQSQLLKEVTPFIESGQFTQGLDFVQDELAKSGVKIEIMPKGYRGRGTRVENGQATMLLNESFPSSDPARKIHLLLHRHMSLILQKDGLREDPNYLKQLLNLDLAFAEAIRLGASNITDALDREQALSSADEIEIRTKLHLPTLG